MQLISLYRALPALARRIYGAVFGLTIARGARLYSCVAFSGIAAILLPDGRTDHSRFRIPIDLHEDSVCPLSPNSDLGQLLRETVLVI